MGSKGGYRLARPASQITLAAMIDAIEGPFKLAVCCSGEEPIEHVACDLQDNCQIKEPVRRVHGSLRQFLSRVSLAQIAFHEAPISLGLPGGACVEPLAGVCSTESESRATPASLVYNEFRSAT